MLNEHEIYQLDKALIISVKEARKIMGVNAQYYDDEEVKTIINSLLVLAEMSGKTARERVSKELVRKST